MKLFALVISISKKSLSISRNVAWLIQLILVASRCIFAYLSWLVVDLKNLMKQLRKSKGVSRLKVFPFILLYALSNALDLKTSMFIDVSKRIPKVSPSYEIIMDRIIAVAVSGEAFNAKDICARYKDVEWSVVVSLIDKLVVENILSDDGARRYVFHSNLEKSYFCEKTKH